MTSLSNTITLLPPYQRLLGCITQVRVTRLMLLYLMLLMAGSVLLLLTRHNSLQILGLGLMWPGGGFLAHSDFYTQSGIVHLAIVFLVLGAFGFSVVVWFGTGNILAPPLVWLGAALWAAGMGHGAVQPSAMVAVYGVISLTIAVTAAAALFWHALSHRNRLIDNNYLSRQAHTLDTIFTGTAEPAHSSPEMSREHLQRLRFALDRALQPRSQFSGFETLDQFQTSATRYQLNFLAYGIAMTQARFTPAFGGYMHQAQIALLDKQREHRVWRYWGLENLWGNLCINPDPTATENIMYTGFVALQMALFRSSTGRNDFEQAGRFTLKHPSGKSYTHNFASLVGTLERGYKTSPFFLIACEPNWVYPLCNTIGASAILAFDAQHQQSRWAGYAQGFRHHLESEFLDGFGRYIPCRSARTGLALPAIGGVMPQAMPCFFLNAIAPDLARRQWLLLRRKLFDSQGQLRTRAFWPIDTGNYGFSRASAFVATALAAVELGDHAVQAACMHALEKECPSVLHGGVIHRRKASVWSHGVELMARAGSREGFKRIISQLQNIAGPRLEGLKYPDVLVARAHSKAGALHAVLYAGADDYIQPLCLVGLQPHAHYRVSGAMVTSITADEMGNATFKVLLMGRTCIDVEPEESA